MLIESAAVLIFLVLLVIWFVRWKFSYWKNLGVPYAEPKFPFGNIQGLKKKVHSVKYFQDFYETFKPKSTFGFGGIYFYTNPVIIPTSLEFLKNVFVKDFAYFHDRGLYYNKKDDPLSCHLSALDGQQWKILREKLSPTFTSGKMKMMFPILLEVAERLKETFENAIRVNKKVEMKTILMRYTTDIIGNCAFGIDCNSLKDPDVDFLQVAIGMQKNGVNYSFMKRMLMVNFPNVARFLKIKALPKELSDFFFKVVDDVIAFREKHSFERNDFMNLLIQLKNKGVLEDDSGVKNVIGKITVNEIAAQSFIFFLGGFETSSSTMNFCLYELAVNPDIQEKARRNVLDILKKYDGKITYEALNEMVYLENCIHETLRKYPIVSNILRQVTKDYKVPDTNITLEKGTMMVIPVYAIQHDPEYFPDPEKYDPDRFSQDEIDKRTSLPFTPYLPFGEGPRICIGMRFGMLETKIGLVTMLRHFKFNITEETKVPLNYNKRGIFLAPEDDIILYVERTKDE